MSNITKKIIILMPFGGDAVTQCRYYKLMLRAFRYIIEERLGNINFREKTFNFSADVFLEVTGDIASDALQAIKDTDIAIAYISATNITVVYELAVRNLLRAETIVILDAYDDHQASPEERLKALPWYIRPYGHLVIGKDDSRIVDEIKALANDAKGCPLGDFHSGSIPRSLKNVIDDGDSEDADHSSKLVKELKRAVRRMVENPPKRPPSVLNIMADLDPEFMVSTSKSYYPSSVNKYTWAAKKRGKDRTKEDLIEDPVVCDWNSKFLDLFGQEDRDPGKDGPLTEDMFTDFMSECVANLADFGNDQGRLQDAIVYGSSTGAAQVPIRFNSKHPRPEYRNRSFLPCSVLKKQLYDTAMNHNLYILNIFFDVTESDRLIDNPDLIGPDSATNEERHAGRKSEESPAGSPSP